MSARAAAHRRLRMAVELLARVDVNAQDLGDAINAMGQVIADLTDQPCKLMILCGDDVDVVHALQAENARLSSLLRLYALDGGTVQ